MGDYISTTDTAKLIRTALKGAFPGSKFAVRSSKYAGGSSIDVHWENGPTTKQVEAVVGHFHGSDFDGMVDLKSRMPGRPYQNDYIFCSRELSEEVKKSERELVAKEYGIDPFLIEHPNHYDPKAKEVLSSIFGQRVMDMNDAAWASLSRKDLRPGVPLIPPEQVLTPMREVVQPTPDQTAERLALLAGEVVKENKWARIRSVGQGLFITDASGPVGWVPQTDYADKAKAEEVFDFLSQGHSEAAEEAKPAPFDPEKYALRPRCHNCQKPIAAGEPMAYSEGDHGWALHERCKGLPPAIAKEMDDIMGKRQGELSQDKPLTRHEVLRSQARDKRRNKRYGPHTGMSRMK
jgi:hypothetical protein